MKKFWILLTALLLVLSLDACNQAPNSQEEEPDATQEQGTSENTTEESVSQTTAEDLFEGEVEIDFSDFDDPEDVFTTKPYPENTQPPKTTDPPATKPTEPEAPATTQTVVTAPETDEEPIEDEPVLTEPDMLEDEFLEETTTKATEIVPPTTAAPSYGPDGYNNQVVRP